MKCKWVARMLSSYLDGELNYYQERDVAEHLAQCAACSAELARLRDNAAKLSDIPQQDPGQEFNTAVMRAVGATNSVRDAFSQRVCKWGIAISIALIVAIASILLYVSNMQEFISKQDVYVLGSKTLVPGSRASMRVVVAAKGADSPVKNAQVSLALKGHGWRSIQLLSGQTDDAGTIAGSFMVPAHTPGNYQLTVTASSSRGKDVLSVPVQLKTGMRMLLTTDKPIYQPGQTIHLRTLALRQPSLAPSQNDKVRLVIQDPKKNKVCDKTIATSKWGIASADFQLADEIISGRYVITATAGDTHASKTVTVKPYVLPKFKISLLTDRTYYLPGQSIRGTVNAKYFFGKPVAGARVRLNLSVLNLSSDSVVRTSGATNGEGIFTFNSRLPHFSAKQAANQGNGIIRIATTVTDGARHTEELVQSISLASEPIRIALVPESGQLVPGIENMVYVVTSFPDGKPAPTHASLTINGKEQGAQSDRLGVAEFKITPRVGAAKITVKASTSDGVSGSQSFTLDITSGVPEEFNEYYEYAVERGAVSDLAALGAVLVRTDQAIYKTGDTAHITVLGTRKTGAVYVDAIRDGQTLLTKTASLKNGKAHVAIDISKDYSGTLTFSAYVLSRAGVPVRDTATVLVQNADHLSVAVMPDRRLYTPGQQARLKFNVTDKNGRGVPAAIGVNIVDESVFSVEKQLPGLSALYFTLQTSVLRPGYQRKLPSEDLYRILYRNPEGTAREVERHMLSPRTHISGNLPDWSDPDTLFTQEDARTIQRAAKVLFASAIDAAYPNISAVTQQTKDEMVHDVQNSFFGYGDEVWAHWLLIIVYIFLLAAMVRTAYRHRRPYSLIVTVLPIANFVVMLLTAMAMAKSDYASTGYIETVHNWSIMLLVVLTAAAMIASARLADVWVKVACGLVGLILLAAIILPMFARARESARRSSASAEFRMLQDIMAESKAPDSNPQGTGASTAPRVRQFFPETLYSNPALITDENGAGSIELTAADSITTWQISAMAHTMNGRMGSSNTPLKVFQDFFVDLDLPVGLTQGDAVSVPVAVYNYLPKPQSVKLLLKGNGWYQLTGPSEQAITLKPNEVSVVYFPLRAAKLGKHTLTVEARSAGMADAVKRDLIVYPNGRRLNGVANGTASETTNTKLFIPRNAIAGASKMLVKLYPGVFSQVVNGLDGLLQVPYGCFEQTSSITYPNVLIAKYLKAAKKDNPKAMLKAKQYINLGYQKLLTFEVEGGGFDWYGDSPANTVLTAYGIMEFADMSGVATVDRSVINRAKQLLESRQQADGSWDAGKHTYDWATLDSKLPVTAYVVWALSEAGFADSSAVELGCAYLKNNLAKIQDPYTIALAANALVAGGYNQSAASTLLDRLDKTAVVHKDRASWQSASSTLTYGQGEIAQTETTALAAHAFLKSHTRSTRAQQALNELAATRDSQGSWNTTQATILALKALLAGSTEGVGGPGSVDVMVNGHKAGTIKLSGSDTDTMHTVNATRFAHRGTNTVTLLTHGKSRPAYQIVSEYYIPWSTIAKPAKEEMHIDVTYGKLQVARESTVDVTARVRTTNNPVKMAIVDLGIAPGFGVVKDDLDSLKSKRIIDRYETTPRQIILYLRDIQPNKPITLRYKLRALYPVKAQTPASRAYDYYNPNTTKALALPVNIEVL